MGQRDNIQYTLAVMAIGTLIVFLSTSSLGNIEYSRKLSLPKIVGSAEQPVTVSLVFVSRKPLTLDPTFLEALNALANKHAASTDLEITVQNMITDEPAGVSSNSKNTFVPSHRREEKLVFGLDITGTGVISVASPQEALPYILHAVARADSGLTADKLFPRLVKQEVAVFNAKISSVYHLLADLDKEAIDTAKKQLKDEHLDKSLYVLLNELNSRMSLYEDEYFQWDYKVGVYAPICIPSLFPIGAALYYRLFVKSKAGKAKQD